jgi:hypothetical protein
VLTYTANHERSDDRGEHGDTFYEGARVNLVDKRIRAMWIQVSVTWLNLVVEGLADLIVR